MTVVAPCITVETEVDYKASIERLHPFAERVHIDISDGEFSPVTLIDADKLWWPQEWTVDIHAMVARPSQYVQSLIELHPNTIIFHAEVSEDLLPIIAQIKQAGIRVGVALLRPTVPSTVSQYIEAADYVLIFSGDLGHYGGKASLMQLEKVRLVRNINAKVEIAWDGGANPENAFSLARGGADVINVGGAINRVEDPAGAYRKMVSEINKHSVI